MHFIFSTFFIRRWTILWLSCVPLLTQAQTGPGGVGNSSSNKVWLDASALNGLSNGASVSSWTDRSGNGWNANQASATNRPSFLSNALNGKPVIHFDRNSAVQYLELTTAGIGGAMSNSNTIFAVAKANSGALDNNTDNSGNHQSIFMAVGYHGGLFFYGYPTTAFAFTTWANDRNTGFYQAMAASQGQWQMGMLRNTGTAAVSSFVSALNGTSAASQLGNFQMFNYADLVRIGVASNPGMPYSWPLNGDIAEIILYNTALNDAQRIIVENYLSAKYNLSGANDYYTAHDPAYSQDVQGIGTTDGTVANKHAQAVNGKGLLLSEVNGSLNGENEFLLAGHVEQWGEYSKPSVEQRE